MFSCRSSYLCGGCVGVSKATAYAHFKKTKDTHSIAKSSTVIYAPIRLNSHHVDEASTSHHQQHEQFESSPEQTERKSGSSRHHPQTQLTKTTRLDSSRACTPEEDNIVPNDNNGSEEHGHVFPNHEQNEDRVTGERNKQTQIHSTDEEDNQIQIQSTTSSELHPSLTNNGPQNVIENNETSDITCKFLK